MRSSWSSSQVWIITVPAYLSQPRTTSQRQNVLSSTPVILTGSRLACSPAISSAILPAILPACLPPCSPAHHLSLCSWSSSTLRALSWSSWPACLIHSPLLIKATRTSSLCLIVPAFGSSLHPPILTLRSGQNMDPAGTDPGHRNQAAQGLLLEQHDQALHVLLARVRELSQALPSVQDQLAVLQTHGQFSSPPPQPPAHAPPVQAQVAREPFVPAPAPYCGDLGSCRAFLVQCAIVFEQQPHSYASDCAKIAYLICCLRAAALAWASAEWEGQSSVCASYPAFTGEMRKIFDHPVRGKEAAKRLMSLRQGSRSVAEFSVEFRTLAAESNF
ncbi:uncharacterized protein LOC144003826 [Festucalex cinctus]